MKKKVLIGIVGLVAVGLLGGCGKKADSSEGDKVTLTYALWDKQQAPVYEKLAKEFEKSNPKIDIKFQVTPWAQYWTKLETAVTGKNAPDVFWMNIPRSTDYIKNGVLEPLDDVKFDKDKIPKIYQEAYTQKDKLYGVPKDYDTNAIWYNKKMFEAAGVSAPDDTWTWDTWKEAAHKLTNKEAGVYGIGAQPIWETGYYQTIYQNNGRPFSKDGKKSGFTDKATIEGVQYWYDFMKDGSSIPVDEMTNVQMTDLLLAGKVAMIVDGSYQAPVIFEDQYGKDNIDVAPMPKGKVRATTSNSLSNVVYSGSKHKEEAKKFVSFLSSEKAMKEVAKSGVVIPAYEGSADAWVNAYPDKNLKVFVDAVNYAVPFSNYKNSSAATAAEQDIINEIWSGKKTVEEGCKEIAKEANTILQK